MTVIWDGGFLPCPPPRFDRILKINKTKKTDGCEKPREENFFIKKGGDLSSLLCPIPCLFSSQCSQLPTFKIRTNDTSSPRKRSRKIDSFSISINFTFTNNNSFSHSIRPNWIYLKNKAKYLILICHSLIVISWILLSWSRACYLSFFLVRYRFSLFFLDAFQIESLFFSCLD